MEFKLDENTSWLMIRKRWKFITLLNEKEVNSFSTLAAMALK